MSPKEKVTLPFWFSDAILTLMVSLHRSDSYGQLLCEFFYKSLMYIMKDPWLYFKCVQPWHDDIIIFASLNPHAMRIWYLFVIPLILQGLD